MHRGVGQPRAVYQGRDRPTPRLNLRQRLGLAEGGHALLAVVLAQVDPDRTETATLREDHARPAPVERVEYDAARRRRREDRDADQLLGERRPMRAVAARRRDDPRIKGGQRRAVRQTPRDMPLIEIVPPLFGEVEHVLV